jgi:hypothetical protein
LAVGVRRQTSSNRRASSSSGRGLDEPKPTPRSWEPDWGLVGKSSALHSAVYEELGINAIRVGLDGNNKPGSIEVDAAKFAEVVEHIELAKTHGINNWIGCLWSPPTHLKEYDHPSAFVFTDSSGNVYNNSKNAGGEPIHDYTVSSFTENGVVWTKRTNRLKAENEGALADHIVKLLQHLRQVTGLPVQISFQNEPRFEAWYAGCIYEAGQYARVAKLLRARLDAAGLQTVRIAAGDFGQPGEAAEMLGHGLSAFDDPAFESAVAEVSIHSYDDNKRWTWDTSEKRDKLIADTSGLADAIRARGKPLWMTEYTSLFHGDFTPSLAGDELGIALHVTRHFTRDLVSMPVSHWVYLSSNDPEISASGQLELDLLGLYSPSRSVVLVANSTERDKSAVEVSGVVSGLNGHHYVSDATRDMQRVADARTDGGKLSLRLPKRSISLIVLE